MTKSEIMKFYWCRDLSYIQLVEDWNSGWIDDQDPENIPSLLEFQAYCKEQDDEMDRWIK